jgi:hypothetical protein
MGMLGKQADRLVVLLLPLGSGKSDLLAHQSNYVKDKFSTSSPVIP